METIRKAYFAGKFYPSQPTEIINFIEEMVRMEHSKINYRLSDQSILGGILPHAAHVYSGYQTVHFFEILKQSDQNFDTWIVMHPLHHGGNEGIYVENSDYWETPLGRVKTDSIFIKSLGLPVSRDIHRMEHSSEVILPFIQKYFGNDFSYVSIGMARQNPQTAKQVSDAILNAIKQSNKNVCLIASSDFSHYINPESGALRDDMVLVGIMQKDSGKIYQAVTDNQISVCGFGPIMALVNTINSNYPHSKPEILRRGHSGEVSPSATVVDYVSMLIHE
ncbi:MAG: AmmeMemoRadiSam system protein B [Bacteroidales bacterium]|nr:AmmeMemoRadiSam system protein B [Bacteroidales bacterium]